MNRTVIAISYNRHMQEGTRACLMALMKAGAQLVQQTGSADVALARNMALTMALRSLVTLNRARAEQRPPANIHPAAEAQWEAEPLYDTVLMVDDDMVFTLDQAQELVTHARETGVGASAMYATMNGTLAATRLFTPPPEQQRWLVGLGLLAIPGALLQKVAKASPSFDIHGEQQAEFTWSATMRGRWYSEDYTLCRRLGGVHLLPIAVGHLKTIPLYPAEETVTCIAEGRRLPGELDSKILAHITDPEMLELMAKKDGAHAMADRCALCGLEWQHHMQTNHVFEGAPA